MMAVDERQKPQNPLPDKNLLVLVDADDNDIGTMEKLQAHKEGVLHRAISVFIFDGQNRVLMQKRQERKYHSKNLWSNTCCSHPLPGEIPFNAARRRLREEMGFDCSLRFLFRTLYKHDVGDGLTEHELVHIFSGVYTGPVRPDPKEADGYEWVKFDQLAQTIKEKPERYSPWLRIYFEQHTDELRAACEAG